MSDIKEKMMVAVMSYNRGKYLENCISSIERNLTKDNIFIYDDNSDDSKTVDYLKFVKYPVIINKRVGNHALRGLHVNINLALAEAISKGFKYLFIIHDDVQIVRLCDGIFFDECEEIFKSDKNIISILPVFFKGKVGVHNQSFYSSKLKINYNPDYYTSPHLSGLADMGIMQVDKLKEANWFWDENIGDAANMKDASKFGWFYVKIKNPIMMYTPWPETFRANQSFFENLMSKFADKFYNVGLHPYADMSSEEVHKLINRKIDDFPIADDFLKTTSSGLTKPWQYKDSLTCLKESVSRQLKKLGLYSVFVSIKNYFSRLVSIFNK